MTLQEQHARGVEAAQVLENHAYKEAMRLLKAGIQAKWMSLKIRDTEGQLLCKQMAHMADDFEAILSGLVQSGKFAKKKLIEDDLRNENAARKFVRRVF